MAGGQERVLRRRIRSVQSTRKITKAMELIAASRIVRAQNRIAANRPYRLGMEKILRITAAADPAAAKRLLGTPEEPVRVGVLAIVRSFPGIADRPEFVDARAIAAAVTGPFVAGEMDMVQLVSTRFISAGTQRVEVQQMLPLPLPDEEEGEAPATTADTGTTDLVGYTEFEPEPEKLLIKLAPRAAESEIFAALLEGAASFFTAQQRAMAAASDNADELVRTLTRVMNRARQDAITTEIMEIVGGAEALRQTKGA